MLKIREKGKKSKLLDSSDSELEDDKPQFEVKKENGTGFNINKNYAQRYDNWRNLEEMQKLKSRLGVKNVDELNESGDSSESSSEEDEEWSTEKEKAFLKTLACLKKKDPKIYDGQFGYFKEVPDATTEENKMGEEGGKRKKNKGDNKPFTVRDHERVMVMEKGGQVSDEEEENNQQPMSYPEELASIKTAFSKALKDIDSSDDEEAGAALGSNLLRKRTVKSEKEQQLEKEAYKLWLKGELDKVEKGKLSKEDKKDLKSLKEYWNDDKLDEGEKFLRDYILNKNYIEPLKGGSGGHIPSYNEVVHDDDELSDDEKFEAEREEFEHKYNFRFEEPDQEFIKRYPRTIPDSLRLRQEEGKRKEQRDKAKERKEEATSRKREEVQRLKALKRKEILDKIEKLHEITGNPDLDVTEMDIEGDFDPEEYDRRMQQIFNDDYYEEELDDKKPVFPYDEELDTEENFEEWTPADEQNKSIKEEPLDSEAENGEDDDDEPSASLTDAQKRASRAQNQRSIQQELIEMSKGKRGRRKRSAFLEALERQKPKFDPKVHKSFEQYFDEYYKLDFEDLVGDLPCRFKYHKTTANDFGLSVNEILKASDKELNQWASLKKTFQYRDVNEEEYEVKAYKQKAEREDLKKRFIPSAYQNATSAEAENESENEEGDNEKQKKKRKKKNKKKNKKQSATSSADQSDLTGRLETDDHDITSEPVESSPKKKKIKKQNDAGSGDQSALSGLESSPKKKKNKKQSNSGSGDQSALDDIDTTSTTLESSPKKKKNKRQSTTDQSAHLETDDLDTLSASVESSPQKKAKKVKTIENDYVQYKTPLEVTESSPEKSLSKRQRKNLKRKAGVGNGVTTPVRNDSVTNEETPSVPNEEDSKTKQKKRMDKKWKGMKRKSAEANDANGVGVDDARLEAYGLNPKKFKKRMKYGASVAKS